MLFTKGMLELLVKGIFESIYMTGTATLFAYIFGLPIGILLTLTGEGGICEKKFVYRIADTFVNLMRSFPFVILMVVVIPITRFIAGTTVGSKATVIPLVIAAAPYVARLVEASLIEVDDGVVEAALSAGASPFQVVWYVLLPEAAPSLINGFTIAITTILGYSAMAGVVGGGGLGSLAINYGYTRRENDILFVTVLLLIILVQIFQAVGTKIARKVDKK